MDARVAIVGGGVAGCECAWGLANAGVDTLLISTSLDTLYALPEERWLAVVPPGTLWATIAAEADDGAGVQRAAPLRRAAKRELERLPALRVRQSNAVALLRDGAGVVRAVRTWEGPVLRAATVVLAVGGFLGARLRYGDAVEHAGRLGEMAYDDLRDDLRAAGVDFVPRGRSIPPRDAQPGYAVTYDALSGHAPVGVAGVARHAGALWVGACAADVGLEGAAIAGRELARRLAALAPGVDPWSVSLDP